MEAGAFVAFDSDATNLVANDTNGSKDIFIAPSSARASTTTTTSISADTTTTTALITTTTSIEEPCPTELLYGEHGEGDKFLGIRIPVLRKMAKKYNGIEIDEDDLIHKAVGWMLREIGKTGQRSRGKILKQALQKHAAHHAAVRERKVPGR